MAAAATMAKSCPAPSLVKSTALTMMMHTPLACMHGNSPGSTPEHMIGNMTGIMQGRSSGSRRAHGNGSQEMHTRHILTSSYLLPWPGSSSCSRMNTSPAAAGQLRSSLQNQSLQNLHMLNQSQLNSQDLRKQRLSMSSQPVSHPQGMKAT